MIVQMLLSNNFITFIHFKLISHHWVVKLFVTLLMDFLRPYTYLSNLQTLVSCHGLQNIQVVPYRVLLQVYRFKKAVLTSIWCSFKLWMTTSSISSLMDVILVTEEKASKKSIFDSLSKTLGYKASLVFINSFIEFYFSKSIYNILVCNQKASLPNTRSC